MPKKRTSWQQLQDMGPESDLKYRDVHGTQRFDRANIEGRRSRIPRTIFSAVVGILASVVTYWIFSILISGFLHFRNGFEGDYVTSFAPYPPIKWMLSLLAGGLIFGLVHFKLMRQLKAQDAMSDTSDINQHFGDQRIALVEEIQRNYDWFPDVGAHSAVDVNSMLSHMAISNKGIKQIKVARRHEKDVVDEDGDIIYYAGELVLDENEEPVMDTMPMFDEDFMEGLFDASGAIKDKKVRRRYKTGEIPYNPGNKNRDKQKGCDTVADLINNEWEFPEYEVQRPGGAYIVDTAPVNTMVLAITRAGKGQTYIEPMIDMWSRMKRLNNMVINDPKGELLRKNYVPNTIRGLQVVQFNLMNPIRTDIFNPLGPAAQAAREGDYAKCAEYIKNIAGVFFPVDGAQDPLWPNAARNASMRSIYGLIDYYLEEEKELRLQAEREGMDAKALNTMLDQMWGQVSLYNCYQMLTLLASKNVPNPIAQLQKKQKSMMASFQNMMEQAANEPDNKPLQQAVIAMKEEITALDKEIADAYHTEGGFLWEEKPEVDALTLFFNASRSLPRSPMRVLVIDADSSLKTMAAAEKMLGSVYGIAVTEMAFFSDPTISTMTSGTPSQNVDLASLSFPRCFGVRFTHNYMSKKKLAGMQAKWDAFTDITFTEELEPKLFRHEDSVSREGWARYYFDGKFKNDKGFIRLRIIDEATQMVVASFYFQFSKDYRRTLDGRFYVDDPILNERIVNGGVLEELRLYKDKDGKTHYAKGKTCSKESVIQSVADAGKMEQVNIPVIRQTSCRYTEKAKAIYLVTPPHLMQYAKIILILIKQLVDLNFSQSYLTKASQKPLYKTHFMLDEVGNLQSDGHGIDGLQTMLSIGLGQDQLFTLILQTLQQLRDVYGDSVDKIIQGNGQCTNAKIATPTGWTTMGEIKVGDEVLTPFGTVTTITGKYARGVRPVYRVTLRDGSSTECCNEHLWCVNRWKSSIKYLGGKDENNRRKYVGANSGKTSKVITEIIDTNELKFRVDKGQQIYLPEIQPLAYSEIDLPIDPYVLGVVLGDGCIQQNGSVTLSFSERKMEIIDELCRRGCTLSKRKSTSNGLFVYGILNISKIIRSFGLQQKRSYEKFIPDIYLKSSIKQRIDLLRGLMDTDGTISINGEIEFTSSSQQLAKDVQTLVRSLGGRVSINVKENVIFTSPNQLTSKQGRPAYRVQNIRLAKINPFLLSRKAQRWHTRTDMFSRVVSVEYVRDDEVWCIKVADERHLYVTDDYIPTHNTSNIVFLKSTDDTMIETLVKMSGTTHKVYRDTKSVTRNLESVINTNEANITYTVNTREEPVISFNDFMWLPERNSIVFRAGDPPIWNRNETILPMSYKLFENHLINPGREYSLRNVPTTSSAIDFDVRRNTPDFMAMVNKRVKQAGRAKQAEALFQEAYGYTDLEMQRMDPEVLSDELMRVINALIQRKAATWSEQKLAEQKEADSLRKVTTENEDFHKGVKEAEQQSEHGTEKIYADKMLCRNDLVRNGLPNRGFSSTLIEAYIASMQYFANDPNYRVEDNKSLVGADGTVYITRQDNEDLHREAMKKAQDENSSVYADDVDTKPAEGYIIEDAFLRHLVSLPNWKNIAKGEFELRLVEILMS